MKRKHLTIIPVLSLALLMIFSAGCNTGITSPQSGTVTATATPAQSIKDITVAEAYALVQANISNPDFIIIDIRTPEEFDTGHLENAILIDYYAADFQTEIGKLDRNKEYLIYCRSANRSGSARDMMKKMGFTVLYNMKGGINDWISQGYPIVK